MKQNKTIDYWRTFEDRIGLLIPKMDLKEKRMDEIQDLLETPNIGEEPEKVQDLINELNSLITLGRELYRVRNEIKVELSWSNNMLDPTDFLERTSDENSLDIRITELEKKFNIE